MRLEDDYERWVSKDLKGGGYDLFKGNFEAIVSREWETARNLNEIKSETKQKQN
jgi:hypothetical protein